MHDADIVRKPIALSDLQRRAAEGFGDLIKAVVDVERGIMAIGGELHADEEAILLEDGAKQPDLWGINLYPADYPSSNWLEFDSMINVRPSVGNRSRSVEDEELRRRIIRIVEGLVER